MSGWLEDVDYELVAKIGTAEEVRRYSQTELVAIEAILNLSRVGNYLKNEALDRMTTHSGREVIAKQAENCIIGARFLMTKLIKARDVGRKERA